ncbi:MAG: Sjogren's syndrome/scleroderma autoantigen 1 family protein [Candidatus Freyarchaeota archaeon]|nr:Sjogren's syndrome/scleroderma autoantigen 1 family protein [Candidatus Freyrarchaeum guaymaensis]
MVDMLRRGATLLSKSCPVCSSPLFKIGDKIWCPTCEKQVVVVREGEPPPPELSSLMLSSLANTIYDKLKEIEEEIRSARDMDRLQETLRVAVGLLEVLERIKRLT